MSGSFDPFAILDALARHDVRYLAVGGWAAVQHGGSRPTGDLDIVAQWTVENLQRLAAALQELGAELRVSDDETLAVPQIDGVLLSRMEIGNWQTRCGVLDVLKGIPRASPQDRIGYEQLITDAVAVEIRGNVVRIAGLADLVRSKQVINRPKDHEALPELVALRDTATRPPESGSAP